MGVFEDLGVMVDGLEDESAEEYGGEVEEIFRFDVYLSQEQEIEIGVQIAEVEVEDFPEMGDEYGLLAHTFADLIVEHIGMGTEALMNSVAELPELDINLTVDEQAAFADEQTNENGSVLLYSFPVLIMDGEDEDDTRQLGTGFNRSRRADLMLKVYGDAFAEAEENYQEMITDAILDHGILFIKAVEAVQIQ